MYVCVMFEYVCMYEWCMCMYVCVMFEYVRVCVVYGYVWCMWFVRV
jgi:hypothetical protein